MKSKKLLLELIELVEQFEERTGDKVELSLPDFLGFLNAHVSEGDLPIRILTGGEEQKMIDDSTTPEIEIARLISLMYRYAKTYIKKALKHSSLQTADEFTYVIILMTHKSLSKTDLINKNVMEKTSGIEVIRRLIKKGLIEQFSAEDDKRSQHVSVTEKGRNEIFVVLPKMNVVSQIVAGNLTASERKTLSYLLKKLDYHHHHLYLESRDSELEEILKESAKGG